MLTPFLETLYTLKVLTTINIYFMICPICTKRECGNLKSHIIPKMFRNELGGSKSKIRIRKIKPFDKNQDKRVYQDIAKEAGLLCDECENNLSVLEGYYARNIYSIIQLSEYDHNYRIKKGYRSTWKEIDNVDIRLINLFYQSILIRQHLSSLEEFQDSNIDKSLAEKIRIQLSTLLTDTLEGLEQNIEMNNDSFTYMPFTNWMSSKTNQDLNLVGGIPHINQKYLLVLNNVRAILVENIDLVKKQKSKYILRDKETFTIEVFTKTAWLKNSRQISTAIDFYLDSI